MTKRIRPPGTAGKELARVLKSLGHSHRIETVFRDWLAMSAYAISNRVDLRQYDLREAAYMSIVPRYARENRYGKRDIDVICEMLPLFVEELDVSRKDVLGPLIAGLELPLNKYWGQVLTPWEVSYMMAKMTFGGKDEIEAAMAEKGYITAMEPTCGVGGMVLAMACALEDEGINFCQHLHVTAVDVDPMMVHATYLQASLFGIPATVVCGNSLKLEETEHWYTPVHIFGGWSRKLQSAHSDSETRKVIEVAKEMLDLLSDQAPSAETIEPLPEQRPMKVTKLRPPVHRGKWQVHINDETSPPYPLAAD
jgi:hypothetical protein